MSPLNCSDNKSPTNTPCTKSAHINYPFLYYTTIHLCVFYYSCFSLGVFLMIHARDTSTKSREPNWVNVSSSTMVVRMSKVMAVMLLIEKVR